METVNYKFRTFTCTSSTFTIDRSLVYMSIDGKKSIFSDGTHIFLKFGPKNGEKSYSLEIIRLKSHIFDKNF